jgi:hypothetical protein
MPKWQFFVLTYIVKFVFQLNRKLRGNGGPKTNSLSKQVTVLNEANVNLVKENLRIGFVPKIGNDFFKHTVNLCMSPIR